MIKKLLYAIWVFLSWLPIPKSIWTDNEKFSNFQFNLWQYSSPDSIYNQIKNGKLKNV